MKVLQDEFGEEGPRRSCLSLASKGMTLTALRLRVDCRNNQLEWYHGIIPSLIFNKGRFFI